MPVERRIYDLIPNLRLDPARNLLIERSQGANGKCFREQPSTIRQSLRVKEAGIHKQEVLGRQLKIVHFALS